MCVRPGIGPPTFELIRSTVNLVRKLQGMNNISRITICMGVTIDTIAIYCVTIQYYLFGLDVNFV